MPSLRPLLARPPGSIELAIPRAETRVVLFTADGQEGLIGGGHDITFTAADVAATSRELEARGAEFVQEPRQYDWGTAAIFEDQDGNQSVLSSP